MLMRVDLQTLLGMGIVFLTVLSGGASQNQLEPLTAADLPKLMRRAERNDPRAQTRLGIAYQMGEFVNQDSVEAVRWFSNAAKQGDLIAEHNLGVMYYRGTGVQ